MKAIELLESSPVIAAIKDDNGLKRSFESECQVVFILYGNICNISSIVKQIKDHGKNAIVHADLAQGLSSREIAVDFIKQNTYADGIISTKPLLVKRAVELGLVGVQRTFIIDSLAMSTTKKQIDTYHPDLVEIMPGVMPRVLKEIRAYTDIPIIAGGLISDKKDIMAAFGAGADAISTTKEELWFM
ncbi:glycerol-3-phosphate responsive antiterminator [Lacrimispora saccharolytica]|uniref:Glycerol-3-phosphate responsive antiterminator, GlpP n=1 Tax=Lacrimispora saccharolytica (strain ATCC 35040 / DSM 2544 / NRCC 2533 / WM1) TaxID=610130 RepID=D9R2I2_LACSW|nr:glycerol-3-phosphate responsive antiterminator [Lacrimispora saccharolytica]ADL06606.1 glycerol-3-phosphate responsive antiterminator, GlpP [[Clostridium] saccharolyticum WM1]QRV19320.1 glycerol-3-phosphate responsive antiterminator [Lacrimispora saccharolytica]